MLLVAQYKQLFWELILKKKKLIIIQPGLFKPNDEPVSKYKGHI